MLADLYMGLMSQPPLLHKRMPLRFNLQMPRPALKPFQMSSVHSTLSSLLAPEHRAGLPWFLLALPLHCIRLCLWTLSSATVLAFGSIPPQEALTGVHIMPKQLELTPTEHLPWGRHCAPLIPSIDLLTFHSITSSDIPSFPMGKQTQRGGATAPSPHSLGSHGADIPTLGSVPARPDCKN